MASGTSLANGNTLGTSTPSTGQTIGRDLISAGGQWRTEAHNKRCDSNGGCRQASALARMEAADPIQTYSMGVALCSARAVWKPTSTHYGYHQGSDHSQI
jgi:hypothetical protein